MSAILPYMTTLSILSVLAVLALGLYTMMHGKSPSLSQNLMRWRVGLQFLAIVIIMATIALKRS
jgi:Hypoxia induced protein conserved region